MRFLDADTIQRSNATELRDALTECTDRGRRMHALLSTAMHLYLSKGQGSAEGWKAWHEATEEVLGVRVPPEVEAQLAQTFAEKGVGQASQEPQEGPQAPPGAAEAAPEVSGKALLVDDSPADVERLRLELEEAQAKLAALTSAAPPQ
jgi:hypothetical protein